jgi:hypothetical protein
MATVWVQVATLVQQSVACQTRVMTCAQAVVDVRLLTRLTVTLVQQALNAFGGLVGTGLPQPITRLEQYNTGGAVSAVHV